MPTDSRVASVVNFTPGLWAPPRWGRRQGLVLPPQKGPLFCRWCAKLCEPPRKAWCSEACVNLYLRVSTWAALCQLIRERDVSCRNCGGAGFVRGVEQPEYVDSHGHHHPSYTRLISKFEVDHIVTIYDGGDDSPQNLRLLCLPCHALVTAIWRRRLARLKQLPKGL